MSHGHSSKIVDVTDKIAQEVCIDLKIALSYYDTLSLSTSRLYLDIKAFLVEREADGIVVLSWYHQQFLDSATERYLSDYLDRNQMHRNIADYYMGAWSGTIKKPFIYRWAAVLTSYSLQSLPSLPVLNFSIQHPVVVLV